MLNHHAEHATDTMSILPALDAYAISHPAAQKPMLYPAPMFDMDLGGYTVLQLSEAENLWPSDLRYSFCPRSAYPWARVSDNYVIDVLCKMKEGVARTAIDRIMLFGAPAPHWQSITPDTLRANKINDPHGMFVYCFNRLHHIDQADAKHPHAITGAGDYTFLRNWRNDTIKLRNNLSNIPRPFIDTFIDLILAMSGEGYLPPSAAVPQHWSRPEYITDKASVENFNHWLRLWLEQRTDSGKKRGKGARPRGTLPGTASYPNQTPRIDVEVSGTPRSPSAIHRRAFFEALGIEDYELIPRDEVLHAILVEIDQEATAEMTNKQKKAQRRETGIVSGFYRDVQASNAKLAAHLAKPSPQIGVVIKGGGFKMKLSTPKSE